MDVPGRPGGPRVLRPRPVLTRSRDESPAREPVAPKGRGLSCRGPSVGSGPEGRGVNFGRGPARSRTPDRGGPIGPVRYNGVAACRIVSSATVALAEDSAEAAVPAAAVHRARPTAVYAGGQIRASGGGPSNALTRRGTGTGRRSRRESAREHGGRPARPSRPSSPPGAGPPRPVPLPRPPTSPRRRRWRSSRDAGRDWPGPQAARRAGSGGGARPGGSARGRTGLRAPPGPDRRAGPWRPRCGRGGRAGRRRRTPRRAAPRSGRAGSPRRARSAWRRTRRWCHSVRQHRAPTAMSAGIAALPATSSCGTAARTSGSDQPSGSGLPGSCAVPTTMIRARHTRAAHGEDDAGHGQQPGRGARMEALLGETGDRPCRQRQNQRKEDEDAHRALVPRLLFGLVEQIAQQALVVRRQSRHEAGQNRFAVGFAVQDTLHPERGQP